VWVAGGLACGSTPSTTAAHLNVRHARHGQHLPGHVVLAVFHQVVPTRGEGGGHVSRFRGKARLMQQLHQHAPTGAVPPRSREHTTDCREHGPHVVHNADVETRSTPLSIPPAREVVHRLGQGSRIDGGVTRVHLSVCVSPATCTRESVALLGRSASEHGQCTHARVSRAHLRLVLRVQMHAVEAIGVGGVVCHAPQGLAERAGCQGVGCARRIVRKLVPTPAITMSNEERHCTVAPQRHHQYPTQPKKNLQALRRPPHGPTHQNPNRAQPTATLLRKMQEGLEVQNPLASKSLVSMFAEACTLMARLPSNTERS
jgi:hypothetical protein